MNEYETIITGFFEYDMMPRVHKVILVGKGYVEDYEIELEVFDISTKKVQSSASLPSSDEIQEPT